MGLANCLAISSLSKGAEAAALFASATCARAAGSAAKQELAKAMLKQVATIAFIRVICENSFRLKKSLTDLSKHVQSKERFLLR
jgi:hypothetical protein